MTKKKANAAVIFQTKRKTNIRRRGTYQGMWASLERQTQHPNHEKEVHAEEGVAEKESITERRETNQRGAHRQS